jgi:hypothetical protein
VPEALPSAFYRGTRQSNILPSVALDKIKHSANPALGKRWLGRHGGHLPSNFVECLTAGTRQIFFYFFKSILPSAITQALGKITFF